MIKKISIFILIIALFAGSIFVIRSTSNNVEVVYANSANYNFTTYSARVGDFIDSQANDFVVAPANACSLPCFTSSNSSIATVNAYTGEIDCLAVGTAIIYGKVKNVSNNYVGDSFTLIVNEQLNYAEEFSLNTESSFLIELNDFETTNALTLIGDNINVLPTISYSNIDIATYDYNTGIITPISEGTVIIYVTVKFSDVNEITKQFTVEVVPELIYIDVDLEHNIATNQNYIINFYIIDEYSDTGYADYQTICSPEIIIGSELISINDYGYRYISISANALSGTVIIKLIYSQNIEIIKNIRINIQ